MAEHQEDDTSEREGAADAKRVDELVGRIRGKSTHWRAGSTLTLPTGRWRPHAVSADRAQVLHVHLATRIRPYLSTRLREAAKDGKAIHIALELASLYEEDTVRLLSDLDAQVHTIDGDNVSDARHLLTTLTDQYVPVAPHIRRILGEQAWKRRREGTPYVRGRRFEGFLGFLLSQVADFRVRERNLRGRTDELDIVVQIDNHSPRCWHKSGAPFILVEAKNWKTPVSQKEVSAFMAKLQTKHGVARVGLMFGAAGFTADADKQVMKYSTQEQLLVTVGPKELSEWIESERSDDHLESLVRRAMLA